MRIVCLFVLLGNISMSATERWENWAKNQLCAAKIITPRSTHDVIAAVKRAYKNHLTIRAYGSGHSWSDIVCAEGYLLNTDLLNKIIAIDTKNMQATVQAGIKLKDLNAELAKHNMCLPNQGAITEQSLAGVVATATHGSGKTGTFASFITKVQLVTGNGSLLTISEKEHADLFGAVRTSVGSLGIMTELTVQCIPLCTLKRSIKTISWQEFLAQYEQLLQDNDYMQAYWNVIDDSVDVVMHNRVAENQQSSAEEPKVTHAKRPRLIKRPESPVGYSHEMLSGSIQQVYVEEEIAIARQQFVTAAQTARVLVQKHQQAGMFSGILFRFVAAEQHNFLSPAADHDVVFFSITTRSTRGYEQFYKEFYDTMLAYKGRPHWGKLNFLTKDDAQKLYGKNFDQFVAIRKKLDPSGTFSSDFTKRIFGW